MLLTAGKKTNHFSPRRVDDVSMPPSRYCNVRLRRSLTFNGLLDYQVTNTAVIHGRDKMTVYGRMANWPTHTQLLLCRINKLDLRN